MTDDKIPNILIVYAGGHERRPLAGPFYKWIGDTVDSIHSVNLLEYGGSLLKLLTELDYNPDYLYLAKGLGIEDLNRYANDLKYYDMKIAMHLMDIECFLPYRKLWEETLDIVLYGSEEGCDGHKKFFENWYTDVDWFHDPWSIQKDMFDPGRTKDIDFSFICTMTQGWPYHKRRLQFAEGLKQSPYNSFVGQDYENYKSIIERSKIAINICSMRNAMVQKYLEYPVAGCMMIGDLPHDPKNIFEDGVSFVVADERNITHKIKYYLEHADERIKIAMEGRRRVLEHFSYERVRDMILGQFSKHWGIRRSHDTSVHTNQS